MKFTKSIIRIVEFGRGFLPRRYKLTLDARGVTIRPAGARTDAGEVYVLWGDIYERALLRRTDFDRKPRKTRRRELSKVADSFGVTLGAGVLEVTE